MTAFEGPLVEVNGHDMFLECGMLSEGLVARRKFSTAILVSSIVCSEMAAKSRPRHEALTATWTVTDVVSDG